MKKNKRVLNECNFAGDSDKIEFLMKENEEIREMLEEKSVELNQVTDRLIGEKQLVDDLMNSSNVIIMVWELNGTVLEVNKRFTQLLGFASEEILGRKWYEVILHESDKAVVSKLIHELRTKYSVNSFENRVITSEGDFLDIMWNDTIIHEPNSDNIRIVSFGIDITEKNRSERKVHELAYKDFLTGFGNRVKFEEMMEKFISENQSFSVIYLDIDNFRQINELHGHTYGDVFLKHVSSNIREQLPDYHCFRWCGDEFMFLLMEEDEEFLRSHVLKLNEVVSEKWNYKHVEFSPTACIGVAKFPDHGCTKSEVLKNVDIALHYAKEKGKSNISMYSPLYQESMEKKIIIENMIDTSLTDHKFKLAIQPIFELAPRLIKGGEVLLRHEDPLFRYGIVDLIEVAEKTGQIIKIDRWVIRKTFQYIREYFQYLDIRIAINLSAKTISSQDTIQFLRECLVEYAVNPNKIEFEITEHSLIEDMEKSRELIQLLQSMGFRVSLDDFGTRYSSLNYLSTISFNTLKVDKSYVDGIHKEKKSFIIVKQIVNLTQMLEMSTVAEGIETEGQYDSLIEMGCKYGQGYYLSKPMEIDQFVSLLSK